MRGKLRKNSLAPPLLKVDAEKYPGLKKNPGLERALRIQQALNQGKPRDEAVRLAELGMGQRVPQSAYGRPKRVRRNPKGENGPSVKR